MKRVTILHYSAPPVVGGVESVIWEHTRLFTQAGYPVAVLSGRGDRSALHPFAEFIQVELMDSQHPRIQSLNADLERGVLPADEFEELTQNLQDQLASILHGDEILIAHNIFSKHFNLPLTAAVVRLIEEGQISGCIAWCHDLTWTSPSSRGKVHPGFPWDLIRTQIDSVTYVAVSKQRQAELVNLFKCLPAAIHVVYNGVNPQHLLGLCKEGQDLIHRLDLLGNDLILLMPVRVTKAKNIELALRIVSALKSRGLRVKLVITGPPDPHDAQNIEYYQSLLKLRSNLGVLEEVRFIYESGPDPTQPFTIDARVVGDLYRVSDALFMPSHREGFGMPVLEAGLAGIPIFSTQIPAAVEIARSEAVLIESDTSPEELAGRIQAWMHVDPVHRLRRRTRQEFTWEAIFRRDIQPIISQGHAGG